MAQWKGTLSLLRPSVCPRKLLARLELELFVFGNDAANTLVLVARLDNLGKGASGAAVQNLNIMLGLDESLGLQL